MIEGSVPKGPPKRSNKTKTNNMVNIHVLSLFLSVLLIFAGIVSAEEGVGNKISADAQASATGDTTSATTQISITDNSVSASASSKAMAENGGTATAEATASANWLDKSSAYAHSVVTAIAETGQKVWAVAYVSVTASSDGSSTATAKSEVSNSDPGAGDNNGGNNNGNNNGGNNNGNNNGGNNNGNNNGGNNNGNNNGGNNNGNNNGGNDQLSKQEYIGMFGYAFGKSDPGRYYYFKRVANSGLQLADDNNSYSRARAKDYMWSIAWDRGLNQTQFENKYKEDNYTIEVENIIKESLKESYTH